MLIPGVLELLAARNHENSVFLRKSKMFWVGGKVHVSPRHPVVLLSGLMVVVRRPPAALLL